MGITRAFSRSFGASCSTPHIEGIDPLCTSLQQAIGESAGRGPDIQSHQACDFDAEGLQCAFKFEPTPAHIREPVTPDLDLTWIGNCQRWLATGLTTHPYLPGLDEPPRTATCLRIAMRHQPLIETQTGRGHYDSRAMINCARSRSTVSPLAKGLQRGNASGDGGLRPHLGLGQSHQARVGGFPPLVVFAQGLAHELFITPDIKDVIHDLKGQPDMRAVVR